VILLSKMVECTYRVQPRDLLRGQRRQVIIAANNILVAAAVSAGRSFASLPSRWSNGAEPRRPRCRRRPLEVPHRSPGRVIAIGLNYAAHAADASTRSPSESEFFFGAKRLRTNACFPRPPVAASAVVIKRPIRIGRKKARPESSYSRIVVCAHMGLVNPGAGCRVRVAGCERSLVDHEGPSRIADCLVCLDYPRPCDVGLPPSPVRRAR
jgi:hypothetical protein